MEILNLIQPESYKVYFLVLARISVVLFMMPMFSTTMMPALPKAGLAMVISLLIYSVVDVDPALFPDTALETGLLLITELMLGVVLSLSIRLFFGAAQLAGQVIGFQMGFSMINVVDPQSGANISIMEELAYWVTVLIFLSLNGHHVILMALIDSFKLVRPGVFVFQPVMVSQVLEMTTQMFALGIKIGAPVIAALLFTSTAFGLTAKFSPQMNVMIIAFPIKIVIGLALFGLSMQITVLVTTQYIGHLKEMLMGLLYFAGGG
ncbi:MAG: flagellar biosynthetic protein FliR [Pseudomonadota bacterium]